MSWLDLGVVGVTFLLIFPAELPDKTFIATLVLSTRFRRWPVWLGVIAAFAVQCLIAVTAGGLLSLLPQRLVLGLTFALFAVGSILLIVSGIRDGGPGEVEEGAEGPVDHQAPGWRIFAASFVVLFTAEWGDLSQLFTAGMAASSGSPASVFIGSWLALVTVAGIAVLFGGWLQQRVPLKYIRIVSGLVLAVLSVWTAVEFFRA